MRAKGTASFGEVVADFDRMEISRSGKYIHFTALEFRLLKKFVDHPGRVFSRRELIGAAWPERDSRNARTVDNCICQLRRKLEADSSRPTYFCTVFGSGYKFAPPFGFSRVPFLSASDNTWLSAREAIAVRFDHEATGWGVNRKATRK